MNNASREILKKFGLENLPVEQQNDLIVALGDTILQAIVVRGLEALTEEKSE